jgi:hypothetical protein
MHPFHEYLSGQLNDMLKKRHVVVFYDPRHEFMPFFSKEIKQEKTKQIGLSKINIQDKAVFLIQYDGSFFEIRNSVESIVSQDVPDPLIIYIPGLERDRQTSVLMELEKGGMPYEPQLKRLALNLLRKHFSDGQIDDMLRSESVGYNDVVSLIKQGEEEEMASVLRSIFNNAQGESLIIEWLATEDKDSVILKKKADNELFKLIKARFGLSMADNSSLDETREKLIRFLLVNEFRSDLGCEPPQSLGMVPTAPNKEYLERVRKVAQGLRHQKAEQYAALADKVEHDLGLPQANLDAQHLGTIDTFRFEEQSLLSYASDQICSNQYSDALTIIAERIRSFWVDRDVARQAQWEAARLIAELGSEIDRIRPELNKSSSDPEKWVKKYTTDNGWYQVDELHRHLETWIAKMDDDPESEQALNVVRQEHEELLKKMASGYAKILGESDWTVPKILPQTRIYPEIVKPLSGQVALLVVDAMRYDMGVELSQQLEGTQDLMVRPAVAALPTITPVGMAALLPGTSSSFSIVEESGKLSAFVENTHMKNLSDRMKFLKVKVPDFIDLTLGKLLSNSPSKLQKMIGNSSLVLVRSQEIDALGENVDELTARAAMEGVIGNVARAIRKLATAGIENFVITADHGHQFSIRKEDDMKTDSPGGDTVDLHRRCWIGHGGMTPAGTVRISGPELGYDTNLDFIFPTGLGVFKSGGGLSFHHGGISLQEMIIPVVSLRIPTQKAVAQTGDVVELRGLPEKITNRTIGIRVYAAGTLFTTDPINLRIVLLSENEQVGQAGMAIGGELDRQSGILCVEPNAEANVGMMLTNSDCESIRIVILDPENDAVLAQSDEIPVKLGI